VEIKGGVDRLVQVARARTRNSMGRFRYGGQNQRAWLKKLGGGKNEGAQIAAPAPEKKLSSLGKGTMSGYRMKKNNFFPRKGIELEIKQDKRVARGKCGLTKKGDGHG